MRGFDPGRGARVTYGHNQRPQVLKPQGDKINEESQPA